MTSDTETKLNRALAAERLRQASRFVRESQCGFTGMSKELRQKFIDISSALSVLETEIRYGNG